MEGTSIAERSDQHMRALEIANQVRLARSDLKRRIARGEVGAAAVIESCPVEVQTMPIAELLRSQRRWGGKRSHVFLKGIPMSESKTIGKMTPRERKALVEALTGEKRTDDFSPLWPAWGI